MISNRTVAAAFELISDADPAHTLAMLSGAGVNASCVRIYREATPQFKYDLLELLEVISGDERVELITAIIQLRVTIRNRTSPRTSFDERWGRLERSLALDGYQVCGGDLLNVDPVSNLFYSPEESIGILIKGTEIAVAGDIVRLLQQSAEDYVKQPPDLNGSLSSIRTAMETLAKGLAEIAQTQCNEQKQAYSWGNAISYLKSKEIITEKEEALLTSCYSLLSEFHRPVGLSEDETVRFARSLALASCWLFAKKGRTGLA